jgi:hypothetical protein
MVPIGLVYSIHDSTEIAIQKMIEASQRMIDVNSQVPGEASEGWGINPAVKRHLELGNSGSAVFDIGRGERLQTYQPIYVADNPTYFLQVATPTETIYSNIEEALADNRIQEFSLLAGTTVAIAVLIAFLARWNVILTREVKKRTQTLEEEFEEMKSYLERVENELSKHR